MLQYNTFKTSIEFANSYEKTSIYRLFKNYVDGYFWKYGTHHKSFWKNILLTKFRKTFVSKVNKHFVVTFPLDVKANDFNLAIENIDKKLYQLNSALEQFGANVEILPNKTGEYSVYMFVLHFHYIIKVDNH